MRLRMVREDTGAPNEGATYAWMAVDETVGCRLAILMMWRSSRRLVCRGHPEPSLHRLRPPQPAKSPHVVYQHGVILLHGNARSHSSVITRQSMKGFGGNFFLPKEERDPPCLLPIVRLVHRSVTSLDFSVPRNPGVSRVTVKRNLTKCLYKMSLCSR
ncbi:hypothetical protein TNCV_1644461 [Trichonephila clavipes]|nr:hypothetical protein TNCV_1644461 [Trichonephila clavipes]